MAELESFFNEENKMAEDWGSMSDADSAMSFDLDATGVNPEDVTKGGEFVDKEGWYHFEVRSVKKDFDLQNKDGDNRSPSLKFELVVQETVPGQSPENFRLTHAVYLRGPGGIAPSETAVKSALAFGLGLKILEVKEINGVEKVVVKGTNDSRIGIGVWEKAIGCQCCARVQLEKGKDGFRDSYRIPFGRVYSPDDPAVADVWKNAKVLAAGGYKNVSLGDRTPKTHQRGQQGQSQTTDKKSGGKQDKQGPTPGPSADDDPLNGM